MTDRTAVIVDAVLIAASALVLGALLAVAFVVPACSSPHGTHPAYAPPQTLTAPLLPQPFATVDGPTANTPVWVDALRCWGAEDYYPEPVVQVVPCPLTDAQGQGGFRAAREKCAGSPSGCYGTIEGGYLKVCPDGAGIPHEFAHAAVYYLTGGASFGRNCEDAPAGSKCCAGVAR
jgi:hypothetical protein